MSSETAWSLETLQLMETLQRNITAIRRLEKGTKSRRTQEISKKEFASAKYWVLRYCFWQQWRARIAKKPWINLDEFRKEEYAYRTGSRRNGHSVPVAS